MESARVMIVDDEPQARRALRVALISKGFEVVDARSGEEALERLRDFTPDIILLDLKMPGLDGIATCRLIRDVSDVPVMIVSAARSEQEKVAALEKGADDFIMKPFGIDELIARIHAVSRRASAGTHSRMLRLGAIEIDLESHDVRKDDTVTHLTAKEFRLLYYFLQNVGKVVTHRRLLQAVWGPDYGNEVEYLRVFVNQLRKKIEPDPSRPRFLLTEPSSGYRFVTPSAASGKL